MVLLNIDISYGNGDNLFNVFQRFLFDMINQEVNDNYMEILCMIADLDGYKPVINYTELLGSEYIDREKDEYITIKKIIRENACGRDSAEFIKMLDVIVENKNKNIHIICEYHERNN